MKNFQNKFIINDKVMFSFIILLFCGILLPAQNVTSVSQIQEGQKIRVKYVLDKKANISLYVSLDGGETYIGPLQQVTGDVGKNVRSGKNDMVWNVLAEMDELKGDNIVFIVKAETSSQDSSKKNNKPREPKHPLTRDFFCTTDIASSLEPLLSYGITFGNVRRCGWFFSLATNFDYSGLMGTTVSYGDYVFSGTESTTKISALFGLVVKLANPFSLCLGAGYGYKGNFYGTNAGYWAKIKDNSYSGVDVSFGMLFNLGGFVLKGDIVTTNFKYWEAKIGIGFSIRK